MNPNNQDSTILAQQIQEMLTTLYKNPDLQKFITKLHSGISDFEIDRYIFRIKTVESAQRTARVKEFESIEDANDYIGVSVVVKDESMIYEIAKRLQDIGPSWGNINFLAEKNVYSRLCYLKKVPPLTYNVLTREKIGEQEDVPVEIRLCTRESHLSNQAIHDTIYKNDDLDISFEEKMKLLCVSQHIAYKLGLLYMREDLPAEERERHKRELNQILKDNKPLLAKNAETFEEVIMEYGMYVYEYENCKELNGMQPDKRMERLQLARNKYRQLHAQMSNTDFDFEQRINMSAGKMKNMNLEIADEEVEV